VDAEGGSISGDRNVTNNSEIETGPVQKPFNDDSDYVKGVSTTTDRAARYRQNIPWFAVYSYGGSTTRMNETNIEEDLVKKSKDDRDVRDKNLDTKAYKVIDMVTDTDLTKDQLEKIKQIVLDKIKKKDA